MRIIIDVTDESESECEDDIKATPPLRYYDRDELLQLRKPSLFNQRNSFRDKWREIPELMPEEFHNEEFQSPKIDVEDILKMKVMDLLLEFQNLDLDYQIFKFANMVSVSADMKNIIKDICETLEVIYKQDFEQCKVCPFGSTVSGIGMVDCDLDIYIDLGASNVDETYDVKVGMWGNRFKTTDIFWKLKRHQRFIEAHKIIDAKTPIIRVRDRVTNIKCDINVVSPMGVKNSEFLAFCIRQDSRFSPLIYIIKYFCKVHEITNSGKGHHLNNYTLVWMIIFFLQTKSLLHTVSEMQENLERVEIFGWNFAYEQDLSKLRNLNSDPSTIIDLLFQFFQFYQNFDFEKMIVCPLVGLSVEKQRLKINKDLPKYLENSPRFGREKGMLELGKPLVVQDPFELNRNIGHAVSKCRLDLLKDSVQMASMLCLGLKENCDDVKFWMLFEPQFRTFRFIQNKYSSATEYELILTKSKDSFENIIDPLEEVAIFKDQAFHTNKTKKDLGSEDGFSEGLEKEEKFKTETIRTESILKEDNFESFVKRGVKKRKI